MESGYCEEAGKREDETNDGSFDDGELVDLKYSIPKQLSKSQMTTDTKNGEPTIMTSTRYPNIQAV